MSFEPDFLGTLEARVTFKPFVSDNGYGDPSFGTSLTLPAHVETKTKVMRSDSEEVGNSTAQVIIPPPGYSWNGTSVPAVAIGDHFLLAGDTKDRRVLDVTVYFDPDGAHHQLLDLT